MNVLTELKVIAQSEGEDYPMKVREVCAEAADQLSYHHALLAKMATHEKQLRDELDDWRGIIR